MKRGLFKLLDAFILDKVFAPEINRFRLSLDLPAIQSIFGGWMHSPQMNIGLFPEWFAPPQPDWPPQTQLTGFVFYDKQKAGKDVSEDLEDFLNAGSPPIIFTAGTAMKHAGQFFRDCIEACQRIGQRGILLSQHPEQLPAELPQGIRHFPYVPFSSVLPRARALVHHGGIGTTAQAIAAGIPHVIRPMAHDQPDTALRVEGLDIGAALNPKNFNATTLASRLDVLISSNSVLERCKSFASKIHPAQALSDTCDLIEDLARDKIELG
jgi:UDP:flavonoid glycosyltransferase YjiC (YdhE family)